MAKQIFEVVLTGGTSGGKTSALAVLRERFSEQGFRVLTVPEVATMLIGSGLDDIGDLAADHDWYMQFESTMLTLMRDLRARFNEIARSVPEEKVLIVYDRAEMDIRAYLDPQYFDALLEQHRLSLHDVRDSYDGVIHMRTAALGAEQFYTTANNSARTETLEQARALDEKTLQAWIGHPHLRVIDNSTDFQAKLSRVVQAISRTVGVPVPLEIERKYHLPGAPDFTQPEFSGAQTVEIEQIYLQSAPGEEVRVRKRTQKGQSTYYRTTKTLVRDGVRTEHEEIISARDYLDLQKLRDPGLATVRKQRTCFVYNNQYFELDHVTEPGDLWLLEIELTEENDKVELPPSLRGAVEVTNDRRYGMGSIARSGVPKTKPGDIGLT